MPASPKRRIFDMSLVQQVEPQNASSMKKGPLHAESVPQLDNATSSTGTRDDDSSIASITSASSTRRTVFSDYWDRTGETPSCFRAAHPKSRPVSDVTSRRSIILSSVPQEPAQRCVSEPSNTAETASPQTRRRLRKKSVSTSELDQRMPLESCLREPIYSGQKCTRRQRSRSFNDFCDEENESSTSSVVRFDMDAIDVRHYNLPQEHHAEDGWSNYFS